MKSSESLIKLMPALIKAQDEIKHAIKDAKNPHFKNNYATLESVIDATKPALIKNKLLVTQSVTPSNTLVTTLYHESGEYLSSEVNLLLSRQDMQQLGSALTYARRYSLAALLNIAQEDDDGNAAAAKPPVAPAKPKEQPQAEVFYTKKFYPNDLIPNPADFVVDFGKKFKGKKLSEIPLLSIDESIGYWDKHCKTSREMLTGNIRAFVVNANEYLTTKGYYPPELTDEEIK